VLSGPICAGKSKLCENLHSRHGAIVVKTRDLIKQQRPRVKDERGTLQRAGEALDRADGGAWVGNALVRLIQDSPKGGGLFVVDSARIRGQISSIRKAYGSAVHHVHLTAPEEDLAARYERRSSKTKEFSNYAEVKRSRTEKNVGLLADLADIVVSTERCTAEAVLVRATALLGLYPRKTLPLVDVLVGGQYGSEGKGNIVGHIAPEYDLLVRVGGPNAGHKVFGDPVEVYHHLPSGTQRAPNAKLLLGAGAVLYPERLLEEIAQNDVSSERLSIDPQAMIIEDADRALEKKLLASIGSTSQGVGSASARKIMGRGGKVRPKVKLAKDIAQLQPFIRHGLEVLEDAFVRNRAVLLEGTQGTSLSIHHGNYPYVTSRDTSVAGCLADAGIAATRVRRVIMVCRTYPIRVADPTTGGETSGPMTISISYEQLSERSGIPADELRKIEKTTTTGKQRRLAEFDWEQLRRSTLLNGPTDIALTFADYISVENRKAYRFEQLTSETVRFIEELERVSGVPVNLISTNFDWRNIIDRRTW